MGVTVTDMAEVKIKHVRIGRPALEHRGKTAVWQNRRGKRRWISFLSLRDDPAEIIPIRKPFEPLLQNIDDICGSEPVGRHDSKLSFEKKLRPSWKYIEAEHFEAADMLRGIVNHEII